MKKMRKYLAAIICAIMVAGPYMTASAAAPGGGTVSPKVISVGAWYAPVTTAYFPESIGAATSRKVYRSDWLEAIDEYASTVDGEKWFYGKVVSKSSAWYGKKGYVKRIYMEQFPG